MNVYHHIKRAALLCLLCSATTLFAQNLGVIKGQIVNENDEPISKAEITLTGNGKTVLSNSSGYFTITGLTPGNYELKVTYVGHQELTETVKVMAGINNVDPFRLQQAPNTSLTMMVYGSLLEGQAKAQSEQKQAVNIKNVVAADQIGNFPDKNAAEAIQRIPGVHISRDQGEGRYILVRGTEPRLNQNTMNGMTLPAPEGDLRTVALDVISVDMLEAIEVSKAITPDMDGDAVGGSVNLVTRQAPSKTKLSVGGGWGYNFLSETDANEAKLLWGKRFNDGKVGVITTFSYEDVERGTDNFEASYDDGDLEEYELRDYAVTRERIGGLAAIDFRPNTASFYKVTTSYSQFDDQEFRRRITYVLPDDEIERELKDRFETQSIISVQGEGSYTFDNASSLNFKVGHSYARESEPLRFDTTFKTEDIAFNSDLSDPYNYQPNPQNENLSNYELDEIAAERNFTNDEHNSAKISYEFPRVFGNGNLAVFEFGAKWRRKEKSRDNNLVEYEVDDITLNNYLDPNYSESDFLDGSYNMGRFHGRDQVNQILAMAGEGEIDFEEDAGDYQIQEDLTAAYGMATLEIGDNWTLLPGFRYERIDSDYQGKEVVFDEEGDYVGTNPTFGKNEDDIFMPMFHARRRLGDNAQFRAAFTRSYARGRVADLVPYSLLNQEDREIEQGNPDLELTRVWNLDLTYERYFDQVGMFTIGGFYKQMDDYIFIFRREEIRDGDEWEITQPLNGESADLWGAELSFNKYFTNGFGIYLNYTYTDSEADIPEREETFLPGQTDEMGNLGLVYEIGGFSVRLSGNLHGEYVEEVGDDAVEDVWVDRHFQVDLNAAYRVGKFKFTLELNNLNDEKIVRYLGDNLHPIQYEQYKTWGRLGFKYDF